MLFPIPMVDTINTDQEFEVSSLSQKDFYNILLTQIQNQNPLDPLKSEKIVSEILQFSNSEKMENISKDLQAILSGSKELNPYQLLGKNVIVEDNQIKIPDSGNVMLGYGIASEGSQGYIEIMDTNGNIVQRIELSSGQLQAGDYLSFQWDCVDNDGNRVATGNYTYNVIVTDADGKTINSFSETQGVVDSIRYNNNKPVMVIGGNFYDLSDILEVS
ncbi:MAG: FlgD immunoglobulin-like domain containing protein [Candidatus Cloacimonadota bacterium]|nr:FlgD immunoglobulin-like domain containing protein [Candidatus Cloacimonadota bacterium]